jgi:dihydroneopterin aldolase
MTLFLASVRDAAEARAALQAGADIVDLKEPRGGALGAVDDATSVTILAVTAGRARTSATIGDLPMRPAIFAEAVRRRAALGADYVKAGLFPGGDPEACLEALGPVARKVRLIVVLFADRPLGFDAIPAAAKAGAAGIMLDTAGKRAGSLLDHLALADIETFISRSRTHGLMAGLAGSLRAAHIAPLLALAPDVLGFRGALCRGSREARLDADACRAVRALIPRATPAVAAKPRPALNSDAAGALC